MNAARSDAQSHIRVGAEFRAGIESSIRRCPSLVRDRELAMPYIAMPYIPGKRWLSSQNLARRAALHRLMKSDIAIGLPSHADREA